ncbi:hypothetical protein WG922_21670 [Ramlibacter sp. AN1015]|uniref:hypothetical protein n=1 Tax=Ramlibacter sp. AN1015 TaxID=3133428 RepID=UPI0030BCB4A5
MRKYLVAAALAACSVAVAQDPYLTGDALQAAVKDGCAEGCVVFNRAEAQALEARVKAFALQAYEMGKREGSEGCRL